MSHSNTPPFARRVLLQTKRLISELRTIRRPRHDSEEGERLIRRKSLAAQSLHRTSPPLQPEVVGSPISDLTLLRHYAQMAREVLSSLPFPYPFLSFEDLELMDEHPAAAGGFADIWKAKYGSCEVVLKAYRCYRSFDIAQVSARYYNEICANNLLYDGGVDVVPLVGVCWTDACPFGLVYRRMNMDLRQHLRSEPNVERVKLLTGIAQFLKRMHDLDIAHGDLRTPNILVDKDGTPRIAGLGNTYLLSHPTAGTAEVRKSRDRLSRSRAPELTWSGRSSHADGATRPTKAGDVYAFGVVAYEVLTGSSPFFGMSELAATWLMLNGSRPSQPNCHEASDSLWQIIESCWDPMASRRMPIGEVVTLLEEELGHIPTPRI